MLISLQLCYPQSQRLSGMHILMHCQLTSTGCESKLLAYFLFRKTHVRMYFINYMVSTKQLLTYSLQLSRNAGSGCDVLLQLKYVLRKQAQELQLKCQGNVTTAVGVLRRVRLTRVGTIQEVCYCWTGERMPLVYISPPRTRDVLVSTMRCARQQVWSLVRPSRTVDMLGFMRFVGQNAKRSMVL